MNLDEYQKAAVLNQDKKVLLVAPPGSGKTTVLLQKIQEILRAGVDPSKVLVLTFSKAAALNMKDRFMRMSSQVPWFGTIHAFCYRELAGRQFKIISETAQFKAMEPLSAKYHLAPEEIRRVLGEISRTKTAVHEQADFCKGWAGTAGAGETAETAETAATTAAAVMGESLSGLYPEKFMAEAKSCYLNYKADNHLLDFDDLEEEFTGKLRDHDYAAALKNRYDWVLVDEFQDLNAIQLGIVRAISQESYFFGVGDEDQCIYEFRGSDSRAMVNFQEYFPDGRKLYLKYNYRSSATIVACANSIIVHNLLRNNKVIVNSRRDETKIRLLQVKDEADQARRLGELVLKIPPAQSLAVIMRTNGEMEPVMRELFRQGTGFSLRDHPYNYYERRLVKDLTAYMAFARTGDRAALLQIIQKPGRNLPGSLIEGLRRDLTRPPSEIMKKYATSAALRETVLTFLERVKKITAMSPVQAVDWIIFGLDYAHYLEKLALNNNSSIHEYLREAEEFKAKIAGFREIEDYLKFYGEFNRVMQLPNQTSERLILSTMHGTKGMEFDTVFILNAVDGIMPHEKALPGDESERRLFYVAVTRARNDLFLMVPKILGGRCTAPSIYIKESSLNRLL